MEHVAGPARASGLVELEPKLEIELELIQPYVVPNSSAAG